MRLQLVLNALHAEVFNREPGAILVNVVAKAELKRYSGEEGFLEFSFKLMVSSRIGQITSDGSFILVAENEEERNALEKLAEESKKKVPVHVIQNIVLNLQPLILIIEKEMGMPITPLTMQMAEEEKVSTLYQ